MASIYLITNKINGKRYVGKTTKHIKERFLSHKYSVSRKKTFLQKAISKYGIEAFDIELIEETDQPDIREIHWISTLKPEYNLTKGGEGGDTSKSPNSIKARNSTSMKLRGRKRKNPESRFGEKHIWTEQGSKSFKLKTNCPVKILGTIYDSIGEAQKANPGISIRKRIDSSSYPDYIRLKTKRINK